MRLHIHMKSGKTLTQRGVKDYSYKYNNNQITAISIELRWWARKSILITSLDMKSIEAMTI